MLYLYQDKGKAINKTVTKTEKYIAPTKTKPHNQRKAGNNMDTTTKNYRILKSYIDDLHLSAEDMLNLFTNYHGLQIMTDDFMQFVNDEFLPDDY